MPDTPFYYIADFLNQRHKTWDKGQRGLTANWSVINLLHHFRGRECFEPRDRIYSLLALCEDEIDMAVAYNVPHDKVLRQTLEAWRDDLCLCSAAVVAQALWPHRFFDSSQVDTSTPLLQVNVRGTGLFRKQTARSMSGTCEFCRRQDVFAEWISKEGVVLCLYTVCADIQGHLFWQPQDKGQGAQELVPGRLYMENWRSGKPNWRLVRDDVVGTGAVTSSRQGRKQPRYITLQLTTLTLIDIVKNGFVPESLTSRRCVNLWRNLRDSTRYDQRRKRVGLCRAEVTT
jgi:hypothetical protein